MFRYLTKNNRKWNQRGQMTIFIALIFQVLFIFFAMVTNIGLVVHDKINLQNSADFAVIYGAQKQAEILNAIAHTNYQIRQSWKLLSWRLRVLGDFGKAIADSDPTTAHPIRQALNSGALGAENMWPYLNFSIGGGAGQAGLPPSVCVSHAGWAAGAQLDLFGGQNICRSSSVGVLGTEIPKLPTVTVIFPPIDLLLRNRFENLKNQLSQGCEGAGLYSWMMAAKWYVAFKFDVKNKLLKIKELKEKLEGGLDIDGNSIEEGVRKTFNANLTVGNSSNITNFEWFNSMANLEETNRNFWLNRMKVFPAIYFTDFNSTTGTSCSGSLKGLYEIDQNSQVSGKGLVPGDPSFGFTLDSPLYTYSVEAAGSFTPWSEEDLMRASIGVEKNPWVMVYNGLNVSVGSVKAFFPLGNSHQLTVKSFAQAFGGRIGAWARETWPRDSLKSIGNKIDNLLPDPWIDDASPTLNDESIPNYSRFPGDSLGLKSSLSLSYLGLYWSSLGKAPLDIKSYENFPAKQIAGGDSLSDSGLVRNLELVALSPDLFDASYYSIDPKAMDYYNNRNGDATQNRIGFDFPVNVADKLINVKDQIDKFVGNAALSVAFYKIKSWEHLLNSWVGKETLNYELPTGRFGVCEAVVLADAKPSPGACIAGGRVGYSVKIVSQAFLNSEMPVGGEGSAGIILNPPPGW